MSMTRQRMAAEDAEAPTLAELALTVERQTAMIHSLAMRVASLEKSVRGKHEKKRRVANLVRRALNEVKRPRIWNVQQYTPRPLRLPRRYYRETLPANPPRIAVVTPSYNHGAFLAATIESVLGQNYPALDYFVKDGGSTDATVDILRGHGDRLRWISEPDTGQSNAINTGFSHVDGDIFCWLNSDDLLLPGSLAYVARYFEEHPDVDILYGHRIFVDASGRETGRAVLPPHDPAALRRNDYVPQETLFWRRRVWDAVGGLDESFNYALDWDFLLRVQNAGFRFARAPRFIGCFRVHRDQKTIALSDVGDIEIERLLKYWNSTHQQDEESRWASDTYFRKQTLYHHAYKLGLLRY